MKLTKMEHNCIYKLVDVEGFNNVFGASRTNKELSKEIMKRGGTIRPTELMRGAVTEWIFGDGMPLMDSGIKSYCSVINKEEFQFFEKVSEGYPEVPEDAEIDADSIPEITIKINRRSDIDAAIAMLEKLK